MSAAGLEASVGGHGLAAAVAGATRPVFGLAALAMVGGRGRRGSPPDRP